MGGWTQLTATLMQSLQVKYISMYAITIWMISFFRQTMYLYSLSTVF